MNMKKLHTLVPAFAFITLILSVATAARPGPGDEYLVTVMNKLQEEEPIITTEQVVVDIVNHLNSKTDEQVVIIPSHSHDNNNKLSHDCDETKNKGFSDDFEPRPNVTAYGGDDDKNQKKYADDFEPRPNITAYGGDDN